jgi:hypothetical protein
MSHPIETIIVGGRQAGLALRIETGATAMSTEENKGIIHRPIDEGSTSVGGETKSGITTPEFREPVMGIARFFAADPSRPNAARSEIDALLVRMDAVIDWRFHPLGAIVVEYRSTSISDQIIEAALEGLGYCLKHISDDPQVAREELAGALAQVR